MGCDLMSLNRIYLPFLTTKEPLSCIKKINEWLCTTPIFLYGKDKKNKKGIKNEHMQNMQGNFS